MLGPSAVTMHLILASDSHFNKTNSRYKDKHMRGRVKNVLLEKQVKKKTNKHQNKAALYSLIVKPICYIATLHLK